MNDPWLSVLVGILPFVVVFVPFYLWLMFGRRYNCPDCGTPLPLFGWRHTKRQWLEGGWICPNCGIDVDSSGRKVQMPWVANRTKIWAQFSALAALGGVGILLVCMVSYKPAAIEPRQSEPEQHPVAPMTPQPDRK